MRGRDRDVQPVEWTGPVGRRKQETVANPGLGTVTPVTSLRKRAEVRRAQVAQKSRSPDASAARTAYRHW